MALSRPFTRRPDDRTATSRPLAQTRAIAGNRWIEGLMRSGQIARGLVYLIPGLFALRLATASQGAAISQTRAIEVIGQQPFGRVLVLVLAVGLFGYILWGLYRAILDPMNRGRSALGLFIRLGYLTSALAYGLLLVFAIRLLSGSHPHEPSAHEETASLMAQPFGPWLVGIVGLCWIVGGGIVQLLSAWRGSFKRELDLERMDSGERWWAERLGRIGLAARGLVFLMIGIALVQAAIHTDPNQSHDLTGALLELLQQQFGRPLLLVVSAGLIVFGVYSILCVRWARLRVAGAPARGNPSGPSSR